MERQIHLFFIGNKSACRTCNITSVIFDFANKEINVISQVKDFAKYGQIREILYP